MEKSKWENTENKSSVFGRILFCISSLKLNFNFSLNLLLRQIWKSQASLQVANQTFASTPIHIHPCATFIIQNLFDQDNDGRGRPHFWLLLKLPALTGNSRGLRKLQFLQRALENIHRALQVCCYGLFM